MVPKECGFLELACGIIPNKASESDWRRLVLNAGFEEVVSPSHDDPIAARAAVIGRKPLAATRSAVPREVDPATWLVLADDIAVDPATAVIRALVGLGQRVVIAQSGRRFDRLGLDRFDVPPGDSDSYAQLFRLLAADGVSRLHLVHLRDVAEGTPPDPLAAQRAGSFDLLIAVQALIAAGLAPSARLTVVTSGAMPMANGSGGCVHPWQATLRGRDRSGERRYPPVR